MIELMFVVAALYAIYLFQTRNLLDSDGQAAPPLNLLTLDGQPFDLHKGEETRTLVYFFAPWCHWCAASAHNLRALRRSTGQQNLSILLVALDWRDRDEVRDYVARHDLTGPVLLGDTQTAQDWHVFGFPTYYVLDSQRQIAHRDFGYSSRFGLWWRTRFTD